MLFLEVYEPAEALEPAFVVVRYELAQQLQPQPAEDPLGGAAVAHDMQVEIEGDSLPQPPASSADQQSMLGLGQAEVVNGSQQVALEAPLTDKQLVQEGKQTGSDKQIRVLVCPRAHLRGAQMGSS